MKFIGNKGLFDLDSINSGCVSCPVCSNLVSDVCAWSESWGYIPLAMSTLPAWTFSYTIETHSNASGYIVPNNTTEWI